MDKAMKRMPGVVAARPGHSNGRRPGRRFVRTLEGGAVRRRSTVAVVGVALSVALASGGLSTASEPNAGVLDDRIERGKQLVIVTYNCEHGTDYTAYLNITITRTDGTVEREMSQPGTEPGNGYAGFFIEMPNVGSYKVRVICRHQFDGSTSKTFYDETMDVVVTESTKLTAAEKKKCKKKGTSAARKRCLKKERAD